MLWASLVAAERSYRVLHGVIGSYRVFVCFFVFLRVLRLIQVEFQSSGSGMAGLTFFACGIF